MGLQSLCIFLIVWAFGLLLVGVIASLLTVLWRIFFIYCAIVGSGIGIVFWLGYLDISGVFLPVFTVVISIIGFLLVECFRRSHKYIISNQRIVFKGGVVVKEERTLRYDKISDINSKQGVLGQIFGFGTIIPISQSGFGLGADTSFAAGGVQAGKKRLKILGIFGGGKEVQTPRTRSYYELHGIFPYKEVKKIVENLVQGSVITTYQQEQVKFQEEQVDLQKEMRDLLKKQGTHNKSLNNEEDIEI